MLERPALPEEKIRTCLAAEYGLHTARITFLPLGADLHSALYRVEDKQDSPYFLKLRTTFDPTSVELPRYLHDQGLHEVIAPLPTRSGKLWAYLHPYHVLLYPFIEGQNAYHVALTGQHWIEFGRALRRLHSLQPPPALFDRLRRETYSDRGRKSVLAFLEHAQAGPFDDPLAAETAGILHARRSQIANLVTHADRLARALLADPPELVLCHSDLHAGNLLLTSAGKLYLVDWDEPLLAPKERDLMYAGGGQMGTLRTPEAEEALFYQGYGQTEINQHALAYYRYERIIQDLAVECEQIFTLTGSPEDRAQELVYLNANFDPDGVLAIACRMDRSLSGG